MNRTPRLSISGIEYLDYQWGIYSGCENHLSGICGGGGRDFNCWAQSLAYRFPALYPDGFNPHYYPEAIDSPKYIKKPSIIGVGWVGDVIGYCLAYKEEIYTTIKACPHHTFMFLTKNPEALPLWSPFPDNCQVGVTATNEAQFVEAGYWMAGGKVIAKVRYLSIEPFLERIPIEGFPMYSCYDLVIIGAQTKPYKPPKVAWVREIVDACDKAGVSVFLKGNLGWPKFSADGALPFYKRHPSETMELRQEMPGFIWKS